ncbi:hypothetical protein MVEN_00313700 [Mycena venus]|uniref:Uncharacterized protein n=1 Tax=Mycena venus TaxID=2733690 RepID=A0A8H6YZB1_9AGAR|nr:hypothetical protein MVEN_00313700 [Mycena venus]
MHDNNIHYFVLLYVLPLNTFLIDDTPTPKGRKKELEGAWGA